jgi:hypothetical protein
MFYDLTFVAPKQIVTFAPEIKPKDHLKYSELFAVHINCIRVPALS